MILHSCWWRASGRLPRFRLRIGCVAACTGETGDRREELEQALLNNEVRSLFAVRIQACLMHAARGLTEGRIRAWQTMGQNLCLVPLKALAALDGQLELGQAAHRGA